jgi:uridine kinase
MTRSKIGASRIIGVSGGSGSGKTTFVRLLQTELQASVCAVLSQDHYYIDQSARFRGDGENVNFDHPDALDFALLARHLEQLRQGLAIEVPIYDFVTHKRLTQTEPFAAHPLVVLDGTLILSQENIRDQMDVSVFIDTPEDVRLERRLRRDTLERGRTREGVLKQFERQVKPMHDQFVEPSKAHATHVVSGLKSFGPAMNGWATRLAGVPG